MHITDHDKLAAALATHDPFTQPYDDLNPEVLSAVGLLDAVVAAKRLRGHAEAFEARVYAAVEARIRAQDRGSSRGGGAFESEVGATVHLPPATLRTLIAESGFLCERFPKTLAQLSRGLVTWRQVKPLLDLTSGMSDQDARAVEAKVLPELGQNTPRIVRNRIQSAIHEVDPDGAAQRHVERNKQRRFEVRPEADGMATLSVFVKAELAVAIQARVNAACRKRVKGDHRTLDQRRADTAVDLLLSDGRGSCIPAASVQVVVNVESLIGLSDTPAQLEGLGPITAAQARALATAPGSELRRLFVDATGKLLHVDPHKYRRSAALDRHIQAQNRTCSFKGCTMPSERCDVDHMHPFGQGGESCEENLHPACRRHHLEKTMGLWTVHREGDAIVWTSTTTGRRYVSHPEPYPVPDLGDTRRPGRWPRL